MKFNINNNYLFNGSRMSFFDKINSLSTEKRLFEFKKSENFEDEFKVISNISVGTAISISGGFSANGITIYGNIESESNNRQIITLKTETRVEVSFLIIISAIIYIFAFIKINETPIFALLLPPILISWFYGVYRIQERALLKKIIRNLNLIQLGA